LVIIIQLAEY